MDIRPRPIPASEYEFLILNRNKGWNAAVRRRHLLTHGRLISHRAQMGVAPLVEVLVRIAHGFRLLRPQHHLEIDRPQAVVLVAVDHARRARNAFPGYQTCGDTLAALVLDEQFKKTLGAKKRLLDFVGMRCIAFAGSTYMMDGVEVQPQMMLLSPCLPEYARTDEAVLRAFVALDLGILEGGPVGLLFAKPADICSA